MSCLINQSLPGRIEPFRLYFGEGNCAKVTTVADVASSLNDKYWPISVPASFFDSAKLYKDYYVWYNVDSTGTDPEITDDGIEVEINADDTALQVATKTRNALLAITPLRWRIRQEGALLTIQNIDMGLVSLAAAGDSGFTVVAEGGFGGDLGSTSSDGAELSTGSETVDITSLQTGALILDKFYLGGEVSLSVGLQEMDIDTWELALKTSGSSFTPMGGTKVAGIGGGTLFRSYLVNGGQLTLKPLSTAAGDNSRNVTIWKSSPTPESINFNNDIQALQVTFVALLDPTRDDRINAFCFGDQEQDGLSII